MNTKGFTLIEFIVIISIFAIMASVALLNFNGFRSNVSLNNLANDIGLVVRQAQVFGWANQSATGSSPGVILGVPDTITGNPIRYSDGVYFSDPKKIILYKKTTALGDPYFDSSLDRVVDTIQVSGPNSITSVYSAEIKADLVLDADGPSGTASSLTEISIAFSRPKPEALFFGPSGQPINPDHDYVGIYIKGDTDADPKHVIIISRTGEIDVQ